MRSMLLALLMMSNLAVANTYNLEDLGNSTLDKNSGLEWLDTSFTKNKSYTEVLGLISAGQPLSDWRYATYDEFLSIFTSRGYTFSGMNKLGQTTDEIERDLFFITIIDLFGATNFSTTQKDVWGMTADDFKLNRIDAQYSGFIRTTYNTTNIRSRASIMAFDDNTADPDVASFLVRNASPVPAPANWAMMLTGLLLVGVQINRQTA